jgi:hypothetical protein
LARLNLLPRGAAAGALVVALIITGTRAVQAEHARAAPESLALTYTAPDTCIDRDGFIDAVRSRATSKLRSKYSFAVTITKGARFRGRLTATDDRGNVIRRDVEAATCAEVTDAIALALSMALEPDDDEAPEAPPAVPKTGGVADVGPTLVPPPTESAPPPLPAPPDNPLAFSVGAAGLGVVGYTPVVSAGGALFGEIEDRALSARLSAAFAESPAVTRGADQNQTQATFLWGAGQADLCAAFLMSTRWTATGCGRFEVGVLQSSSSTTGTALDTHAWYAVGVAARLRWLVASPFFLELSPWATAPITAQHYIFNTVTDVHDVPLIVGGASLGAGFRFQR